jgi:alkylhydroperoxidase family enzyme
MTRLTPIPVDAWPPEMREVIAAQRPPNPRHPYPPRDPSRPQGRNVLGLLAHYPGLSTAYHHLIGHLLWATTLTVRQRELLILRVAHLREAPYEWAQHAFLASEAGLSPEEVARVRTGGEAEGWEPLERALLGAVDDLIADARIGEQTYGVLSAELDTQQMMDLVFTVGAYETLAMAMRTFDLELDDDLLAYR